MIQATADNIIIRLKENPTEIKAGAVKLTKIGADAHWKESQYEAVVVSLGPLVRQVGTGETILIKGDSGHWIDHGLIDSEDTTSLYRFITEDDILGTLSEVPT